ncbi:MAG: GNAT family N-acetyltransferase [Bacteroidetes bacterium]|nr:GNAT family N-acetyltransferase [Bacteroidota bacterium]
MSQIRISQAIGTDAPVLAQQNVALALESEGMVLNPATTLAAVQRILGNPVLGTYYTLRNQDVILCRLLITYEYSDWRDMPYWWIQSVYTEPGHRGKGYFRQLYRHILEEAKAAGAGSVRLYFAAGNLAAGTAYQQLGMETGHYVVGQQDLC